MSQTFSLGRDILMRFNRRAYRVLHPLIYDNRVLGDLTLSHLLVPQFWCRTPSLQVVFSICVFLVLPTC